MKNITSFTKAFCVITLLLQASISHAQQTISYPLDSDFSAASGNHPALTALSNNSGQTGDFQTTASPANFCPDGEDINAYHFEENAGLAFDNSNGFLGCEYTIELLFKYDELPSWLQGESPWVALISFEPNEDSGIFYEFNPLFGTFFEVWRNNTEYYSVPYTFDVNNWHKVTVVRECSGIVKFYRECTLFGTYDDSGPHVLLPEDQVIFFQDNPNILVNEAEAGFVRNIRLSNFAMSPAEITTCCTNLCDDLVGSCLSETYITMQSCDINEVGTDSSVYQTLGCDSLVITSTTFLASDSTFLFATTCKPALVGITIDTLPNTVGCDSIVITNTILELPAIFEYELITCDVEESGIDSIFYDCDSIVINNTFLIVIDTVPLEPIVVSAGSSVVVFGNVVTQPGLYCQTGVSVEGCDSTTCQLVEWLVSTSEPTLEGELYIPSAFSPNGDGANDFFTVFAGPTASEIDLFQVFNHQGQLLFERSQLRPSLESDGWDGTFRGKEMSSGVYLFLMVDGEGERRKKKVGSFTLIR